MPCAKCKARIGTLSDEELLERRISKLGQRLEETALEPLIRQFYDELLGRGWGLLHDSYIITLKRFADTSRAREVIQVLREESGMSLIVCGNGADLNIVRWRRR